MHYVATSGGDERSVEVSEVAPYRYRINLGGRTFEVDAQPVAEGSQSLLIDGEAYLIESETDPRGRGENVLVRGHVINVEALDLRKKRLREVVHADGGDGPQTLSSPMPGKVVAVLVQEGQEVKEGQGLVVVEAMKMENELRAPKDGVVRQLSAQVGNAVEGGVTLCVVE